ncbi:hypothetical protein [Sphingobium aquiterrae]|uniref:hypothetical protein n=1 Tax=Sphingobium aquiterrae TaxID=2038656 RepID=UPI0030177432
MRYPDLLRQPTRFAAMPGRAAQAIWAILAALFLWGTAASWIVVGPSRPVVVAVQPMGAPIDRDAAGQGDIHLYQTIIDDVRAGKGYYAAAAQELRTQDYPLRPFVAFRLPTLAMALAAMPDFIGCMTLALLCGAVILAWTQRIGPTFKRQEMAAPVSLLLMLGCVTIGNPTLTVFHESWAALLLALALAVHRPARFPRLWWPSVLLALLAVLIRELALPFLLLMAALALYQRRRTEATGWIAAIALFGIALALHAHQVALVTTAADPASPGWAAMGGWTYFIASVHMSTVLTYLPTPFAAAAVPLALLGWAAWRDSSGLATFLFLSGFALLMMLAGRPDNFYWAVMVDPLLLTGLIFVPAALRDLALAARAPRRRDIALTPASD